MSMPQRVHTQPGHEVEILPAFEVVEKNTFAAVKANGIPVVGGEKKAFFKIRDLIESGHGLIVKRTDGGRRVDGTVAASPREAVNFHSSPRTFGVPRGFSGSKPAAVVIARPSSSAETA